MFDAASTNVVEAIPYDNFKEKIKIVLEEVLKGRHVEIWDNQKLIYSEEKNGRSYNDVLS